MVLYVPDVGDVYLGSGKCQPFESGLSLQCIRSLRSDHFRRFVATMCHVPLDRGLVVTQCRRAVLEFLVVAEDIFIVAMKWLSAERVFVLREIQISEE